MQLKYNDRVHGYWLDGKRCKGVSTLAKATDDTERLERWGKRQVLIGAASSPPLVEAAAAHFTDRDKLDELCEEALRIAKSHHAAMTGTAVHRVLERADTGEPILPTPAANAVVLSWQRLLDAAGFEVVPEYVERIVVYPDHRIAGRLDRILRRKSDGRLFLGDVKTGPNAVRYPHSTAIQLAAYANAPLMASAAPSEVKGDSETYTEFEPMPDIDRDTAYVAHVTDSDSIVLVPFNIAAAQDAVQRIVFPMLLEWRPRTDLVGEPITASIDAPADESDPFDGLEPTPEPSQVGEQHKAVAAERAARSEPHDLRAHLVTRCRQLADLGHKALVLAHWPAGAPKVEAMTDEQLAALDVVVARIEAEVEAPFASGGPVGRGTGWTLDAAQAVIEAAFPGAEVVDAGAVAHPAPASASIAVDEGGTVDVITLDRIEAKRQALEPLPKAWVGRTLVEMKDAGRPLLLKANPTERRAAIARALIEWSGYLDSDGGDEIARAALSYVSGWPDDVEFGAFGSHLSEFTLEQARALHDLAKQLTDGDVVLDYSSGACRIVPKANAA